MDQNESILCLNRRQTKRPDAHSRFLGSQFRASMNEVLRKWFEFSVWCTAWFCKNSCPQDIGTQGVLVNGKFVIKYRASWSISHESVKRCGLTVIFRPYVRFNFHLWHIRTWNMPVRRNKQLGLMMSLFIIRSLIAVTVDLNLGLMPKT